ncbi:hypothetical protein PENTCL1PPCAC_10738 [Pristionchus entomophagus]|uniref:Uncharacterized protein n=1 Tax=Pristionchus entomophagus TaxID=358040 RepID=A0AAV5SZR2_9BILA|nr:hypothetical protein PENTCL1PPCAC_10738 [Pristionchus entomophagus]
MQPMSSMQTTLLPGVTPGWNDPPPIGNPSSGSRLNRYRRVVDPSLTAAGGSPTPYAASPQPGMAMGAPHGMLMQAVQQPVLQMQQPQQYMQQPMQHMHYAPPQQYAQPDYSMPTVPPPAPPSSVPQQLHGGNGDETTPPPPISVLNHQQPQPAGDSTPVAGAGVSPPPMAPSLAQQALPSLLSSIPHPSQSALLANPNQWDPNVDYADQARQAQLKQQQQMAAYNAYSRAPSAHSSPAQLGAPSGLQFDAPSYVFNHPPNAVYGEEEEGKLMQFVDVNNYRPPSKAPGDVSLPPAKLHEFLVKAATTLHNSKSQGVQLRLRDLPDELRGMSADLPFIKKFNYVVDYIDRSMLDAAQDQLTQLVSSFPSETFLTTPQGYVEKKWVGGIKFLIQEMRTARRALGLE